MVLTVSGVLSDYKGRVLLQQIDARTLAPIRRMMEIGELPADTLARAFREDTSLIVLPVRLTGMYYRDQPPNGEVAFYFRCIMRGGDLLPPDGRPPAGFFDSSPLPQALGPRFRQPVAAALEHAGGPPDRLRQGRGSRQWFKRLLNDQPPTDNTNAWGLTIRVIARRPDGQILWSGQQPEGLWTLPAATPAPGEAPWEAAERLVRQAGPAGGAATLSAVEIATNQPAATFIFTVPLEQSARLSPGQPFRLAAVPPIAAEAIAPDALRLLGQPADPAAPTFTVSSE